MPKLNKQEKEYAVARINAEIRKVMAEEFPKDLPTSSQLLTDFKEAAGAKTLKLLPTAQITQKLAETLLGSCGNWMPSIPLDEIIRPSTKYASAVKLEAVMAEKRVKRRAELDALAQPLIDEIQLGQADASKLAEIVTILKG